MHFFQLTHTLGDSALRSSSPTLETVQPTDFQFNQFNSIFIVQTSSRLCVSQILQPTATSTQLLLLLLIILNTFFSSPSLLFHKFPHKLFLLLLFFRGLNCPWWHSMYLSYHQSTNQSIFIYWLLFHVLIATVIFLVYIFEINSFVLNVLNLNFILSLELKF